MVRRAHMAKALTFRRRYRQELQAYAFLWPALLILGLLMVYPLLQVIRMSFYEVTLQKQTGSAWTTTHCCCRPRCSGGRCGRPFCSPQAA